MCHSVLWLKICHRLINNGSENQCFNYRPGNLCVCLQSLAGAAAVCKMFYGWARTYFPSDAFRSQSNAINSKTLMPWVRHKNIRVHSEPLHCLAADYTLMACFWFSDVRCAISSDAKCPFYANLHPKLMKGIIFFVVGTFDDVSIHKATLHIKFVVAKELS